MNQTRARQGVCIDIDMPAHGYMHCKSFPDTEVLLSQKLLCGMSELRILIMNVRSAVDLDYLPFATLQSELAMHSPNDKIGPVCSANISWS